MNRSTPDCTVLVVDPCQDTQAHILSHMQERGFSVITVADPAAALATIDLTTPDIVLTDSFLPEGGGLALTKTLRSRLAPCPVIVMSEQQSEQAVIHALRAGAVDYLHKPIGVEELSHALQRARHQRSIDIEGLSGILRSDYSLAMESDPVHIPGVVSWLLRATATTLSDTTRLHLRGALQELLLNAVEHGTLDISYHGKQEAIAQNRYGELVQERLLQSRRTPRAVTIHVHCDRIARVLEYTIADEGRGFDWQGVLRQAHMACDVEDTSGRGIFLARSFFPSLSYNEHGNAVTFSVPLD
ncbi:MAG: response regulator [Nitrospira sp.]|jgi:DNA-binding response OmpR family regulator|nr:response regulator [Nitrospira sp.]